MLYKHPKLNIRYRLYIKENLDIENNSLETWAEKIWMMCNNT